MPRAAPFPTLFLGVVAVLAVIGCAQTPEDGTRAAQHQGYRWAGAGEPPNFGSDYGMCRREASADASGGMGSYDRFGGRSARADAAVARRVRVCMEGRGWQTVDR